MAVFIDTGIFVAVRNESDKNHAKSVQLMKSALLSEFGAVYTSDYIVDEAITTALVRTGNHRIALNTGHYILDSPRIERIQIGNEEFQLAWEKFKNRSKNPLSFTDCTTLSAMELHGIQKVMSFDSDFDGIVSRIH
jgi:uncharacterized protein